MPEIIISALGAATPDGGSTTLRERISFADFDSGCFGTNLLERIEWAVSDAADLERRGPITGRVKPPRTRQPEPEAIEPEPEAAPKQARKREPVGV